MAKRRVFIDGQPRWKAPKITVLEELAKSEYPSLPVDDYDFQSNRSRFLSDPIRYKNEYWPVIGNSARSVDARPNMQRIGPPVEMRPQGCDEIWHILENYGEQENDPDRVWAVTVRCQGGGLRNLFIRAGLRDVNEFPFATTQIVSKNIRPLNKIRFPSWEYFIPERDFCYVGYPYR